MLKDIQEWIQSAEYDLQTAEAMLKTKRYLYVTFMCQQALEKLLKATYLQTKKEMPPRTHNLLYLVDVLAINIKDTDKTLFSQLNQFYLQSRYPGERIQLAKEIDKNKAGEILKSTKGAYACLKQMLP